MVWRRGKEDKIAWHNYGNAHKYGAETVTVDGVKFQSKREARRWCQLRLMEQAGEIRDLRRQVRFELIPAQYEADITTKTGKKKRGRCIERSCVYIADFAYIQSEKGEYVVEDAKGVRTDAYVIKRKLMLYVHGIQIKEV